MGFVARELSRISVSLGRLKESDAKYQELYAAQQALSWAIEPNGFKSPYDLIMGTQEGSKDCPATHYPAPSSDICGHFAPR
jgi:hypothetical protein